MNWTTRNWIVFFEFFPLKKPGKANIATVGCWQGRWGRTRFQICWRWNLQSREICASPPPPPCLQLLGFFHSDNIFWVNLWVCHQYSVEQLIVTSIYLLILQMFTLMGKADKGKKAGWWPSLVYLKSYLILWTDIGWCRWGGIGEQRRGFEFAKRWDHCAFSLQCYPYNWLTLEKFKSYKVASGVAAFSPHLDWFARGYKNSHWIYSKACITLNTFWNYLYLLSGLNILQTALFACFWDECVSMNWSNNFVGLWSCRWETPPNPPLCKFGSPAEQLPYGIV